MILPSKHIRLSESYIGLGGFILSKLKRPTAIDKLWTDFQKVANSNTFPANHSFDSFVLTVDILYSLGLVEMDTHGKLQRAAN
nr:ABC-three component system middle component 6 [uncultured Bdellovibrio sp.]